MGVDLFGTSSAPNDRNYSYNEIVNIVNSRWNDSYSEDEFGSRTSNEDGMHRLYRTKADYARALNEKNVSNIGAGDTYGNYFNMVTSGMDRDQKVDAYLNGTLGTEDFTFDDGSKYSRSIGSKSALQSKGSKYQLQEYLGETVDAYVKRREESKRRDALRAQMLKEKDIIDGGKSKQQTNEGGLG